MRQVVPSMTVTSEPLTQTYTISCTVPGVTERVSWQTNLDRELVECDNPRVYVERVQYRLMQDLGEQLSRQAVQQAFRETFPDPFEERPANLWEAHVQKTQQAVQDRLHERVLNSLPPAYTRYDALLDPII